MFYSSFGFNRQTQFLTPKGPSFKWAPTYTFNIDGTEISLKVPRYRHKGASSPFTARRKIHIGSQSFDTFMQNTPGWQSKSILYRWWDFYGPNFTGRIGSSQMQAFLLRPSTSKEGVSFFHPRVLENLIADFLTFYYNNSKLWVGPKNWQTSKKFNTNFVVCDAVGMDDDNRFKRFLFVPLKSDYVFCMTFSMSRVSSFDDINLPCDQWVDRKPFIELMDNVINSLHIKLSQEALMQQEEALKDLPLEQRGLVKEFSPLKWD